MASLRTSTVFTLLFAVTVLALPQPQGKTDSSMPFLTPSVTATATATAQPQQSSTINEWEAWSHTASAAIAAASKSLESLASIMTPATTVPYSNPFTAYTSLTDSRGVITGMPAVATSIPSQAAVVTSIPTQASVVTVCSGCASVMSAEASWSSMVSSIYATTSSVTAVSQAVSSASGSGSATKSSFVQQATGNAGMKKEFVGSGVMIGLAGIVAAVL